MNSLVIITHGYPSKADPIAQTYTRAFAHAVAQQNVKVSVIAPLAFHRAWRWKDPQREVEIINEGTRIEVFRPRYLSASHWPIMKWNTCQIGLESFCMAVRRVLRSKMEPRPDALYGHFLYLGGAAATRLGNEMGIPSFAMVGEGQLCSVEGFGFKRARRHFASTTGFMPNSSCLARLLCEKIGVGDEKIGVFPNGINLQKFYPRDKLAMRHKLGLPPDRFIVSCVGFQDIQKGPIRVGEAIRDLEGVSGVFLGKGPNPPVSPNTIINQTVEHHQVPEWLSAADVFVLPSTYEGSCNAVLEAMACGLPVIASSGECNDDILNAEVSIRVDPLDVHAIRQAIIKLRYDNELRIRMGKSARLWARGFEVDDRAARMILFMDQKMKVTKAGGHHDC